FVFTDTTSSRMSPLSLHDALPICRAGGVENVYRHRRRRAEPIVEARTVGGIATRGWIVVRRIVPGDVGEAIRRPHREEVRARRLDRKSTRLNSSHQIISYAVFCLK